MINVLIGIQSCEDRVTGRLSCEDGGRGQSDGPVRQGLLAITRSQGSRGWEHFLPQSPSVQFSSVQLLSHVRALGRNQMCPQLELGLLLSSNVREYISVR